MADLTLSEDSKQFQSLARDFAQNEILPAAHQFDKSGEFPRVIYQQSFELGLLNARLPETLGGTGLSLLDTCVIYRELATACSGITAAFEGNDLFMAPLLVAGTSAQQKKYLAPMAEALSFGAFCFPPVNNEQTATYDKTKGDFHLNLKNLVGLNTAHAAAMVVFAADKQNGKRLSAFVLDKETTAFKPGPRLPALGRKAADLCLVDFQGAVPADSIIGQEGAGQELLEHMQALTMPLAAAMGNGIIGSALANALRYSQERKTFGKPISSYQAVNFMLADMAKDNEAAALLTLKAAALADRGQYAWHHSAAAKAFATDSAIKAATDAVQIYGGYGYSKEYPVEKLMRDAKALQLTQMSSQNIHVRLAEQLMGV